MGLKSCDAWPPEILTLETHNSTPSTLIHPLSFDPSIPHSQPSPRHRTRTYITISQVAIHTTRAGPKGEKISVPDCLYCEEGVIFGVPSRSLALAGAYFSLLLTYRTKKKIGAASRRLFHTYLGL